MLFGSQARGQAEAGSDIDVLVVLVGPVRPGEEIRRSLNGVAELSLENNVVFSCVFVSRDRFENELSPLLINVRRLSPGSPGRRISAVVFSACF